MLPTFLVIGAQKAGTTSLHRYLRQHPQVFMPELKELDFFVAEMGWRRGRAWYEEMFEPGAPAIARGEASPSYAMYPAFTGVPERMAGVIPDARLIYLVRHPLERMRSSYLHALSRRFEHRPIDVVLLEDIRYLTCTMYALQMEQFLEHFSREQLLVLTAEELRERREATMKRALRFIGVDEDLMPTSLDPEHHRTADRQVPGSLGRRLSRVPGYERALRATPGRFRRWHWSVLGRPVAESDAAISPEVEAMLREKLRPDLRKLRAMLGPDFRAWGLLD